MKIRNIFSLIREQIRVVIAPRRHNAVANWWPHLELAVPTMSERQTIEHNGVDRSKCASRESMDAPDARCLSNAIRMRTIRRKKRLYGCKEAAELSGTTPQDNRVPVNFFGYLSRADQLEAFN